MAKIISSKKEKINNVKLVGKKYPPSNNGFAMVWNEWFKNHWFSKIENLKCSSDLDNGYIGLMVWNATNPMNYKYWVGVFIDKDVKCPEGFEELDIPDSNIIVYYIKGKDDGELYNQEGNCFKLTEEAKIEIFNNNGKCYGFERYNCPRFTEQDENGEVILDFALLIK